MLKGSINLPIGNIILIKAIKNTLVTNPFEEKIACPVKYGKRIGTIMELAI